MGYGVFREGGGKDDRIQGFKHCIEGGFKREMRLVEESNPTIQEVARLVIDSV
jgi:hypothetical protein